MAALLFILLLSLTRIWRVLHHFHYLLNNLQAGWSNGFRNTGRQVDGREKDSRTEVSTQRPITGPDLGVGLDVHRAPRQIHENNGNYE